MEKTHQALVADFEHVAKKQKVSLQKANENIDKFTFCKILEELTKCKMALLSVPAEGDGAREGLKSALDKLASNVQNAKIPHKFEAEQKELYQSLTKYGKIVDKHMQPELGGVVKLTTKFNPADLNTAVAEHLLRQGKLKSALAFCKESGTEMPLSMREPFEQLSAIIQDLRQRRIQFALQWAESKRAELAKDHHSLEFRLHKFQFCEFLIAGKRNEALMYGRANFPHFVEHHLHEVQRLMTSLLFITRLSSSPYADLASPAHHSNLINAFTRTYGSVMGLSKDPPLAVAISAGYATLPLYTKLATLQEKLKKPRPETFQAMAAQVEIELSRDFQYHSIFTCPVSREQSTKDNPPMLLTCGHVICKNSMTKLARAGSTRFKCPYCPQEQSTTNAIPLRL